MSNKSNLLLDLNTGWKFSISQKSYRASIIPIENIKPGNWFSADVPGTVHTDLLRNKLIDDPYYSDNELKLEWVAKQDWIYLNEFDYEESTVDDILLVFEGLDTKADVYLNEARLGSTENMFINYKFNLAGKLKKGRNLLKVIFHSPVKYARSVERKYGKLPVEPSSERVYIRKAQYSFGWDWGPSFPTSGIWKNVYIEKSAAGEIESFSFNTVRLQNNIASVVIKPVIRLKGRGNFYITINLFNGLQSFLKKIKITSGKEISAGFNIKRPDLWWPNNYGEQPLYNLEIKLHDSDGNVISEISKKVGVRKAELILRENKKPVFKFRINNKVIYCKGADWIPSDSFIPRISDDKYCRLLELAKDGNMNMIRVWGGGFYENDKFYELCDELGLLVWQDFMFACGAYPEHDSFVKNVKREINENVIRLQYHPSIVVWCGNNENEWIWYREQYMSYKKMPGYKIYHSVIPSILKKIDPLRPYWPSSPFGNEDDPDSFESGNTHQWDVWSRWVNYTQVVKDKSLFVTEFGFQGPANKDTFEENLLPEDRNINSRIFEHHNKQIEGPERIVKFLSNHLPLRTEWDDYLYLAQLNQGFALKTCLEHWITNGRTNGSLVWQINDSWPVTSWAIVDYELRPKLAYYFVKNIFSPQIIHFNKNGKNPCEIFNKSFNVFEGSVKFSIYDLSAQKFLNEINVDIKINGHRSKVFGEIKDSINNANQYLIFGSVYNPEGLLLHRNYFLDNKWKYIKLPAADLSASILNDSEQKLKLRSNGLNMFIDPYYRNVTFNNRGFILLPGEEVDIKFNDADDRISRAGDIKFSTLNDYLN
jgi:beta-mannosidase